MAEQQVFITVDTEHSIGGTFENPTLQPVGNDKRIYGRIKGKEYGIPLIMDIADRYGIPLTFYVEVLNKHYFGEEETREVCRYILDRGHDVQLHLHPNYLNFREADPAARKYLDNMSSYDLATQIALIGEGKNLLTRYCGHPPVAFRAGNYGADRNTLKALKVNGFLIDSSYNAAVPRHSRRISAVPINDALQIEGVLELPITNFIEAIPLRGQRFKPLDLNGVSFAEIKAVLERAKAEQGPKYLTFILHSFSFLKARDIQYSHCRVRNYVVERFENLCRYMQCQREHFHCWRTADFAAGGINASAVSAKDGIFKVSSRLAIVRGFEQKIYEFLS